MPHVFVEPLTVSSIVLLPGCGHSPHHQRRKETLALMTAFLRKHLAS